MTTLFKRAVRLVVDTIEIVSNTLDVAFDVRKTLKPEPNTAAISIWNLNPDHRSQLEQLESVVVQLDAGYEDATSLLFLGRLRRAETIRDGADLITTIESGDGEKEYQQARVNESFPAGTSADVVLKRVAQALGVGLGNLNEAASQLAFATVGQIFSQGTVLSGGAAREMTAVTDSLGLEWSIQNGAIQLLRKGTSIRTLVTLLSPDTGLIGSPTVDGKGNLSAQCLLIPDIVPGSIVQIASERLSGTYRVEACRYVGDTAGQPWYIDMGAKPA